MEAWEKLGKPARKSAKEERKKMENTKTYGSTESCVNFTVGGSNHLDIALDGSREEIRLLGLTIAPDNIAEVAFQLKMSRGQVRNLVNLLSSWLKLSERGSA